MRAILDKATDIFGSENTVKFLLCEPNDLVEIEVKNMQKIKKFISFLIFAELVIFIIYW
jgi:hypothetical protein